MGKLGQRDKECQLQTAPHMIKTQKWGCGGVVRAGRRDNGDQTCAVLLNRLACSHFRG